MFGNKNVFLQKIGYNGRVKGEIFISILDTIPEMKPINIDSVDCLVPFFEKVGYEACEYSFTTMYMWQQSYGFRYLCKDEFALIFGEYEGHIFMINPLCEMKYLDQAFEYGEAIFSQLDMPLRFRAVTQEIKEYLERRYANTMEYINSRDAWDYFYEGEKMRTLSGRKLHSKKNHLNAFLKEYGGRFEYKLLTPSEFHQCIDIEERWAQTRERDENIISERLALPKIFANYKFLPDLRVGGIYVDGRLEAFTIGDYLNPDTALIHVEKANPEIRGLYVAMSVLFLRNEFPEVLFVNREEDLGLEGLRKAKLSYKPLKMVEKYYVKQAGLEN